VTDYLDISLTISPDLPHWPGSPAIELSRRRDMDRGDPVNDSTLVCGVHTGTHVDAPLHFLADGADVTHLSLDALIGPAVVAELSDLEVIAARDSGSPEFARRYPAFVVAHPQFRDLATG
jgi:arylformamidase